MPARMSVPRPFPGIQRELLRVRAGELARPKPTPLLGRYCQALDTSALTETSMSTPRTVLAPTVTSQFLYTVPLGPDSSLSQSASTVPILRAMLTE